jgi:biopolymer transport protein ExbD
MMSKTSLKVRKSVRMAPAAEPNVIPFIDVMLVLLIIFMVTVPKPTTDLHVDLPGPNSHYEAPIEEKATVVSIRDEAGRFSVLVDGEEASLETLGEKTLDHARANNPAMPIIDVYSDARIFVRADQGTAYGNVVEVMNRLREAHFVRVGIYAQEADG